MPNTRADAIFDCRDVTCGARQILFKSSPRFFFYIILVLFFSTCDVLAKLPGAISVKEFLILPHHGLFIIGNINLILISMHFCILCLLSIVDDLQYLNKTPQ